jgi:hypothetical protein
MNRIHAIKKKTGVSWAVITVSIPREVNQDDAVKNHQKNRYVVSICCGLANQNRWFGRSWLVLSAATVKIGSFMCGGKENADRSEEVWPRTECILFQDAA